jgi:hypothetical protein
MVTMKKIIIGIIVGVILVVIVFNLVIFAPVFTMLFASNANIIHINWGINLPTSYTEIYSVEGDGSIFGDAPRYHIFQYKNDSEINKTIKWMSGKNTDMESDTNSILKSLKVSDKYMPDYQKKYKYYTKIKDYDSTLYLVYFNDTNEMYIIENFI